MKKKRCALMFVDFKTGIAGLEETVASGIHCWIRGTAEFAKPGEFREVSETLAACAAGKAIHDSWSGEKTRCEGGWNPRGFHGGKMTNAAIGLLAVVEGIFRRRFYESDIGQTVELGGVEYLIRPCKADLMPIRLWERHEKPWRRAYARKLPFGLNEARRLCFEARKNPTPQRVYFAKGTTSVEPPPGAVARIGGSESSTVIFVDKFARPIAAYKAAGSWNSHYAQSIPIPATLDWQQLQPLGKSIVDVLFGVHG